MKVVERKKASADQVTFIEGKEQNHWQDCPLIAIIFNVKPLNDNIIDTYFDADKVLFKK